MIIPTIKYPAESSVKELVDLVTHWSLFGKLALTHVSPTDLAQLEQVVKRVGGLVDLNIHLDEHDEQIALTLLNAGATYMLCSDANQALSQVPDDRMRFILNDESQDRAIPKHHYLVLENPTAERVGELEMARVDCLVDIDLLTADLIADFFDTVLVTDRPDGLWSTVIVDSLGMALGLAYSNRESLHYALEHRVGTYWSRSRDGLWIKGETSGATQRLLNVRMDCDRDCLRFMVTQDPPGFCHRDTHTCFGQERTIQSVMERLLCRMNESDEKSFTRKLANDATMLEAKLLEEAKELSDACQQDDDDEIVWEAADVLYFSLVAMLKNGVTLDQVHQELARRMNRVVRRKNKLEDSGNN